MANLYNVIDFLCMRAGIKPGKLCSEIGISRGILSDLKSGRSKSLSLVNMQKIANYFQVSTDIFNEGVFEETLPSAADMDYLRELFLKDSLFNEKKPTPEGEQTQLSGTYLRLARGAQKLGLDDEDVDAILALYAKHRKKNQ